MEDGVAEVKELVSSTHENLIIEDDADKEINEAEKGGGVLSNLISSFVTKDEEEEEEGKPKEEEEKEEEGGIISHFIGNLVSPLSPTARKEGEDRSGSGGMFSNLISGILHQKEDEKNEGGHKHVKPAAGGGGGLIENLASHLPPNLSEEAAPATEEASILIHSIVHD